ncbi:hypothetical protein, partial [Schinkia azotoformans]|uniref:hypothetical protein n=2 Tax=Schinkia azotoformans TaxID=1454 RepID=UPI002DBF46E4
LFDWGLTFKMSKTVYSPPFSKTLVIPNFFLSFCQAFSNKKHEEKWMDTPIFTRVIYQLVLLIVHNV